MKIKFYYIPDYMHSRYVSWKGSGTYAREPWLEKSEESRDIYFSDVDHTGTTFNAKQVANINSVLGIPVSVNFLHPICNQKLAILVQVKPSMRTISLDGRAKNHAVVLDKIKHSILYYSGAGSEIENAIRDMLITGMGLVMVVPTTRYQNGSFNTAVTYVPFDEAILDINSRKRSLEDMEGFFIEKVFTKTKTLQLYGDIISQVKDENGNPVGLETFTSQTWEQGNITEMQDIVTPQYNNEDRVVVREFYEKYQTTMYTIQDKQTGLVRYIFAENLSPEESLLIGEAIKETPGIYIKKTLLLGNYCVGEEILPITQYPLKAMFFEWGGKPYRSYGMIHFNKDTQKASDKMLHIMILNGILSNNAGYKSPMGAISSQQKPMWENYANDPRAIKEYTPVVREEQVFVPEREEVQQLSNFYPMVMEMLRSAMEYSTGINPIIQGNAKEAGIEVFSSLQQYQNAAMMRIQLSSTHVNQTLVELGQVLNEYIVANLTPDNYYFFDDKGYLNELAIVQEIANDIKMYTYLTLSIPSTAMPTVRLAASTELMKIAQSTPDMYERSVYTQTAMDLAEIPEFDQLREKLDVVRNTQAKLDDLQEAYNRLMETSKQMENKYIQISLENRIIKQLANQEKQIAEQYAEVKTHLSIAEELRQKEERKREQAQKEASKVEKG